MCTKPNPHLKCLVGIAIMIICVVISTALYFSYGGGIDANIEMNGEKNKSVIQQSAGIHLIEVNNSGDCKGNWSYAEYAVVVLVFVLFLKCTHLCHYCFLTKKLVNSKVAKNELQMKNLNNEQANVVIIPGI